MKRRCTGRLAGVLAAVWLVAFRIQRLRYDRFQAVWHHKVAAHRAVVAAAPVDARFLGQP